MKFKVLLSGRKLKAQGRQIFPLRKIRCNLTVKTKEQTLLFERGNQSSKPKWLMKAPSQTPASDASVSYLMNLLAKGKSDRAIQVPVAQLQEYGLDQPQATIEVKLKIKQLIS